MPAVAIRPYVWSCLTVRGKVKPYVFCILRDSAEANGVPTIGKERMQRYQMVKVSKCFLRMYTCINQIASRNSVTTPSWHLATYTHPFLLILLSFRPTGEP